MWFKNLCLYRFTKPFDLLPEVLDENLSTKAFRSVGKMEPVSAGWSEPLGREGSQLVHVANGCFMICLRKEEKILPAAVVNELLAERALEIEEQEGRKVRRKERQNLKDEILLDMMPRAFSKNSRVFAYIHPGQGWLVVDAVNPAKAEELINLLRETLGTLPVVPITVSEAPSAIMTGWLLQGSGLADFAIEDECELRDPGEEGGIVRMRKQDLSSDEIRTHLDAGKIVTRLAMMFDERIAFVLDEKLLIKRLRFQDVVLDEAGEVDAETAAQRFDTDFVLMTMELSRFIPRLTEVFGGLDESAA